MVRGNCHKRIMDEAQARIGPQLIRLIIFLSPIYTKDVAIDSLVL